MKCKGKNDVIGSKHSRKRIPPQLQWICLLQQQSGVWQQQH